MFGLLSYFNDPLLFWAFAIPLAMIGVGLIPLILLPGPEKSKQLRGQRDE